jgi:RimJ/RimL family protein N-acetyltransferase
MPELRFPDPPLTEGVIALRPWALDDAPFVARACQDPSISRYSPNIPFPYTEADALDWLKSQEPARLAGRHLNLAVVRAGSSEELGAISLGNVDMPMRSASIGYWLYERLVELGVQLKSVQDERASLEDRWLAVAEELGD